MAKPHIDEFKFELETSKELDNKDAYFYNDWPVVYLINNDKELYVGETYHIPERIRQHLKNPRRKDLKTIRVISSKEFTKSATLDIESSLIELCDADNKYELQNETNGLVRHSYANKGEFDQNSQFFASLWYQLREKGLVKGDIESIRNSDLFKYSPYKTLNAEQCTYRDYIISDILDCFKNNKNKSIFVNGSSGTGKSILAIYLMKLLKTNAKYLSNSDEEDEHLPFINELRQIKQIKPDLSVAYVVSMVSFRKTIANVFKSIKGLKAMDVISPYEVKKKHYDILIIDESHRLKRRKNLSSPGEYSTFDKCNQILGFTCNKDENDGNQLDWILKQSQIQIFFYDPNQTIKPSDINYTDFNKVITNKNTVNHNLSSQMRCLGGNDYIKYIENIFNGTEQEYIDFSDKYDFKLFDSIDKFCEAMYEKEKEYSLCRIVAGYAWEWKNKAVMEDLYKSKRPYDINSKEIKDIEIEGRRFYWNRANEGWPTSIEGKRIIEEFGCIHTIQGYDLNYCGVVIGPELTYDKYISIIKKNYHDVNGSTGIDENTLDSYIKHIYCVLMSRGIKGTYVYVCDPKLREYLKKYISIYD